MIPSTRDPVSPQENASQFLDPGQLVRGASRHLFLTGKGGVGKTSHACALALALAETGRSVLLVSTDPASNLSQVLGTPVSAEPTEVIGAPGLRAMNVDPEAATRTYRETALEPLRSLLSEADLLQVEEQLSGACTTEIATFDAFTSLLADPQAWGGPDHVVFDTAPTGHTLRLLQLPAAWTGFLERSPQGASCLGPAAGQDAQRVRFQAALATLQDPSATTLYLVTRPEATSLSEAARTSVEFAALGITNQRLIVNGLFLARDRGDPLALALEAGSREALHALPPSLARLPRLESPLRFRSPVGLEAVRELHRSLGADPPATSPAELPTGLPELPDLVDELARSDSGLVMVMGKGGVGKTSLAAAIAVGLADRGHRVHLATTDPAAHLDSTLPEAVEGIRVSRINPEEESRIYRERVMRTRGGDLDAGGRALLAEDLESPCTEEVAVFQAFSRLVSQARREWVVLDTAPTGHTLLLMDTAGAYHREVMRTARTGGGRVTTPLMRLQDPEMTRILLATLPESTPVEEARSLQEDLRRAGIEPWAWVVNRSLAAAHPTDPLLVHRGAEELPLLDRVQTELARRVAVVPWLLEPPVGASALRNLAGTPASTLTEQAGTG